METFLRDNLSADALRRDPVEQRLARFRGFKKQAGTLCPEKMLPPEGHKIRLLARDGHGQWLEYSFVFEKDGEGKIAAILAAPSTPKNVADLSGPPFARAELPARVSALLDEQAKSRPVFRSGAAGT